MNKSQLKIKKFVIEKTGFIAQNKDKNQQYEQQFFLYFKQLFLATKKSMLVIKFVKALKLAVQIQKQNRQYLIIEQQQEELKQAYIEIEQLRCKIQLLFQEKNKTIQPQSTTNNDELIINKFTHDHYKRYNYKEVKKLSNHKLKQIANSAIKLYLKN